jgi:hypothetical protein
MGEAHENRTTISLVPVEAGLCRFFSLSFQNCPFFRILGELVCHHTVRFSITGGINGASGTITVHC